MYDPDTSEVEDGDLLAYVINQMALNWRTIMIAECVSFDETKNTVQLQPLLMSKELSDTEARIASQIQNVLVSYYGAGGHVITHKPKKGDVCAVKIVDRSIEGWKKVGGVFDPKQLRHHNINDAIADFGINHYGDAFKNIKDGIDIRTRDGLSSFNLNGGDLSFTSGGTEVFTANASEVDFKVPIKAPSIIGGGKELVDHLHPAGTPPGNTGTNI
ncbi:hypothetical protein NVP1123O_27 [Vibrio phage 1.123.O._10N.286.48.F3]|nr:hypothetical protein NVP1123O_27 [Vibrio phage 1.123.O._10N.286.48.F3]